MELEFAGQRYPVPPEELTLGSDPAAGIVLPGALPRHGVVRRLGDRMATIRVAADGAAILVNGVAVGQEPTPLLHGDTIQIGEHRIAVLNPAHPVGGPTAPPAGARERLHDTLHGLPRPEGLAPGAEPEAAGKGRPMLLVVLAGVAIAFLAWILLS